MKTTVRLTAEQDAALARILPPGMRSRFFRRAALELVRLAEEVGREEVIAAINRGTLRWTIIKEE